MTLTPPSLQNSKQAKPPRSWPTRWIRRIALIAGGSVLAAVLVGIVTYFYFDRGLPSVSALRTYQPPQVTKVTCADGTVCAEFYRERRTLVPLASLPAYVKDAFLAAEDAESYRRVHDHAAGLPQLASFPRKNALAKNQGVDSRPKDGEGAEQRSDPQPVPQPDLLWPQPLRDRGSRPLLLWQARQGSFPRRGGHTCRRAPPATPDQPPHQHRKGEASTAIRPRADGQARVFAGCCGGSRAGKADRSRPEATAAHRAVLRR